MCSVKFWLDPARLESSREFARAELRRRIEAIIEESESLRSYGMSISGIEVREALARSVTVSDEALTADLADGRTIAVPWPWLPSLLQG